MGLRTRFLRTLGLQRVPRDQPRRRRSYAGAMISRLTNDWMSTQASADAEIRTSIRKLRDRSREMVRNNPYAKQAKRTTQSMLSAVGSSFSPRFSKFVVGSLMKRLIA
jgi:capsid protein